MFTFALIVYFPFVLSFLHDEPIPDHTAPEYHEWLIQQGLKKHREMFESKWLHNPGTPFPYTEKIEIKDALKSENPIIDAPSILSNIPLCKESPKAGDIYAHINCILSFFLYLTIIASFIIFLWRSCKCFNKARRQQDEGGIEMNEIVNSLKQNEYTSNNQNSRFKPSNPSNV